MPDRHSNSADRQATEAILIRSPKVVRIISAVVGVVLVGVGAYLFLRAVAAEENDQIIFMGIWTVGVSFFMQANLRNHVVADGDELRIRNFLQDQRYRREDVAAFGMVRQYGLIDTPAAELSSGRFVMMNAAMTGPLSKPRRQANVDALQAWLDS